MSPVQNHQCQGCARAHLGDCSSPESCSLVTAGLMPAARYQHSAVFVGARLHISGGAVGGGRMVEEANAMVVLDTGAGVWCTTAEHSGPSEDWTRR